MILWQCEINKLREIEKVRASERDVAERGYLQKEVAAMLGMNRVSFNHIINGNPSWPTLEKIVEILHAEPWELFYTREELIDLAYRETKKLTT